jgi:hypothetical protein
MNSWLLGVSSSLSSDSAMARALFKSWKTLGAEIRFRSKMHFKYFSIACWQAQRYGLINWARHYDRRGYNPEKSASFFCDILT